MTGIAFHIAKLCPQIIHSFHRSNLSKGNLPQTSSNMSSRTRPSTRASTAASDSLAEIKESTKSSKSGGDSRKQSSARVPKASEMAKLKKIATFAYILSLAFLSVVYYVVMNDIVRLYPSSIRVESLKGFNSRAEYALRYQSLLFAWLVFNVHSVIYVRLTKKALNPLVESTEKHAQAQKNILTNSFEQIVLSAFLQLAFASFADPAFAMKIIPAINIVQFLGRIAFFLGYPLYRTFGVSLTMSPNLFLTGYNLYKLGSYLNFY